LNHASHLLNVPNVVTFVRIFMIPVFVLFSFFPHGWAYWLTAIIFSAAALTDWLDGYLARRLDQATRLGAFLDPVADKLIVVVALVLLVDKYDNFFLTVPAVVITMREILISALREWMAEMGKRTSVAVSYLGKVKTTVQMVSIIVLLLAAPVITHWLVWLGFITLYVAAGLTVWSMFLYMKAAWPVLTGGAGGEE
jgi:CDP-diacylglycerol--glycerol-3-phosphate 3-phosphatidyltransferase